MPQARPELNGLIVTIDNWVNYVRDKPNRQKQNHGYKDHSPKGVCECFGATCSFCRQQVPHPLPDQSDWSIEDWDGDKAKAREQNPIVKFDIPRPKPDKSTLNLVDSL